MNGTNDDTPLRNRVLESSKEISQLLKSLAHPARVYILGLLMEENNEFSDLMLRMNLSKTALANHLNHLNNMGLVKRISRGRYTITVDGKELLNAVSTVYRNSIRREENQREALRNRYTRSMVEEKILIQKIISNEAIYQPCWLSYTGAIAGSLKALGTKCDIVDVGGYSGYAFLINVSKGTTCPSGPTALGEVWKKIHKATENLGWTIEHYASGSKCFPEIDGKPTPNEIKFAMKLYKRIKREIDERDRPVVLWGLVAPEYGIVKGYKRKSYLTSTFRHLNNQPEDPIPFYDLHAPGGLEAFFFQDKVEPKRVQLGIEALDRAICFAEARDPPLENYVAGPKALDEWANVLVNIPEKKQNYHGNSYVAACVCEGRAISCEFLKRLAEKNPGEHSKHLLSSAECYSAGVKLMEKFNKIFPFKFQGEMKQKDRNEAADLLKKVKPFEEEAIVYMKKALETWRTKDEII